MDGAFSDHPMIDFNFVSILVINNITCRRRHWRRQNRAPHALQQFPDEAPQIAMQEYGMERNTEWKEISRALDRIFFWVFLALIVLTSFVIYAHAGHLASVDNF